MSFRALVAELRQEIKEREQRRHRARQKPSVTEAMAKGFWSSKAEKPKPAVLVKAQPQEPSPAQIRTLARAKLAELSATATKLAQAGKLSGVEAAKIDARLARYAQRVAAL